VFPATHSLTIVDKITILFQKLRNNIDYIIATISRHVQEWCKQSSNEEKKSYFSFFGAFRKVCAPFMSMTTSVAISNSIKKSIENVREKEASEGVEC